MLTSLPELQNKLLNKYHQINFDVDFELPQSIKSLESFGTEHRIMFSKYSFAAVNSKGQRLSLPNSAILIAYCFVEYYDEVTKFQQVISNKIKLTDSEEKNCDGNASFCESVARRAGMDADDTKLIVEFLKSKNWWCGGKSILRTNDYYLSPILYLSNLIAASSEFVPSITKFLSGCGLSLLHDLEDCLSQLPHNICLVKEKYWSAYLSQCLSRFLEYDPNFEKAKNEFTFNTSTVGVSGLRFGKKKSVQDAETDPRRIGDCDKSVVWTINGIEYYCYKENNPVDFSKLRDCFQKVYWNRFKLIKYNNYFYLYQLTWSMSSTSHMINGSKSLQQIWYGAPGTGKSHTINLVTKACPKENVFRTTFHPDSDYSTFVGSYKPAMSNPEPIYGFDSVGKTVKVEDPAGTVFTRKNITYKFVPQAFLKAYVRAYQTEEPVYLVIEEINRGNCAQIFGDLFQLLDRKDGVSEYPIKADNDLAQYLMEEYGEDFAGIANGELCLPNNLHIWATMNTSDQSLFPIDSAFKRRWDWEYVPIEQPEEGAEGDPRKWKIKADGHWCYWWEFLQAINEEIEDVTHSEDKQLGYFFAKPQDGEYVDAKTFVSKVVFYLWNDVFKDENSEIFRYKDLEGKWKVDMPAPKRDNLYFRSFVKGREDVDEKMVRWFVNNLLKEHKVVLLNDIHQTPVTSDDNPKEEEIAWMRPCEDVPPADEDRTEGDMSSINVTDVNFLNDEYKPADQVENVDR